MSYCHVYRVLKDGNFNFISEIHSENNNFMPAIMVWSIISKKIYGNPLAFLYDPQKGGEVWEYWKNENCSDIDKQMILLTLPKSFLEENYIEKMSNTIRAFMAENGIDENTPLGELASCLEKEAGAPIMGMCFHHLNETPNVWEEESYNFLKNKDHFGVYSSLSGNDYKTPVLIERKFTKEENNGN